MNNLLTTLFNFDVADWHNDDAADKCEQLMQPRLAERCDTDGKLLQFWQVLTYVKENESCNSCCFIANSF